MKYTCKETIKINKTIIGGKGEIISITDAVPSKDETVEDVKGYCDIHNLTTNKFFNATWLDIETIKDSLTEGYRVIKNSTIDKTYFCKIIPLNEFQMLVLDLTDGLKCAEYDVNDNCLYLDDTVKADETGEYWNEYVLTNTLSKYFNINITSVHTDDNGEIMVWISYKPIHEEDNNEYIKDTIYESVWDDGFILQSKCKVNIFTRQIFDIEIHDVEGLEILQSELLYIDKESYEVFPEDEYLLLDKHSATPVFYY
jgi:hypothetical protein